MDIDALNEMFQPLFEAEVRRLLPHEIALFSARWPAAKRIYCGMGSVSVTDSKGRDKYDNKKLYSNWGKELIDVDEDPFIQFLQELQYHPLGFCLEEIKL